MSRAPPAFLAYRTSLILTTPCQTESDKCANGRKRLFHAAFRRMRGPPGSPAPRLLTNRLRGCNAGSWYYAPPWPACVRLACRDARPTRHCAPVRLQYRGSRTVAGLIHGPRFGHMPPECLVRRNGYAGERLAASSGRAGSACRGWLLCRGRGLAGAAGSCAGDGFGAGLAALAAATCQQAQSEQQDGGQGPPRDCAGHSASFRSTCGAGAASQALAGVPCLTVAGRLCIAGRGARCRCAVS
ncbi:hypothetical protein LMG23992_03421 [Cupriavidus laharis]|uniref:Uncharacterized protein n=1 Tax=Cupriavidus laharis TaxID=151654 RepID=A0ABN7YYK1_9BURK|nr:hypothetical protein LMG23992_03421 [Cupriavidus laharis]